MSGWITKAAVVALVSLFQLAAAGLALATTATPTACPSGAAVCIGATTTPTLARTPTGFRICGRAAERTGKTGYARGVTVELNPLGVDNRTDVLSALFCFDDVLPGIYTVTGTFSSQHPKGLHPSVTVTV